MITFGGILAIITTFLMYLILSTYRYICYVEWYNPTKNTEEKKNK